MYILINYRRLLVQGESVFQLHLKRGLKQCFESILSYVDPFRALCDPIEMW